MPQPALPAIVTMPSMKSVGVFASGIGSGSQRSWFGGAGTSSKRLSQRLPTSARSNGELCVALGRMRYSQLRRFRWRGIVNAVPVSCSVYRPYGARCGALPRSGSAPGNASVANSLAKPLM